MIQLLRLLTKIFILFSINTSFASPINVATLKAYVTGPTSPAFEVLELKGPLSKILYSYLKKRNQVESINQFVSMIQPAQSGIACFEKGLGSSLTSNYICYMALTFKKTTGYSVLDQVARNWAVSIQQGHKRVSNLPQYEGQWSLLTPRENPMKRALILEENISTAIWHSIHFSTTQQTNTSNTSFQCQEVQSPKGSHLHTCLSFVDSFGIASSALMPDDAP